MPARAPRRWRALAGLTLGCVAAHAVALQGLGWIHAAALPGAAESATLQVSLIAPVGAVPGAPAETVQMNPLVADRARPTAQSTIRARSSVPAEASTVHGGPVGAQPPPAQPMASLPTVGSAHLPTHILDVPPMPRSAPDEQFVDGVHKSGLPIRVRLFIELDGTVSAADLLSAAPGDEESAAQVMAMFSHTAFSPGRREGRDVPSYIDIEIVLEPTLPEFVRLER